MKSVWHFGMPGACECDLCELSFFCKCTIVERRMALTAFGAERAFQIFVKNRPEYQNDIVL